MVRCSLTTEDTVALSGTLDTFALPDVLRLLASTAKSGRLRVSGDRGSGSLWVTDGEVVASELTTINSLDPSAVEVVFGLLRFEAGSFTFEADAVAPNAGAGMAMDPILTSAEHMLVEWETIEKVVPSLDVWVALQPELSGPDVMVDAMRWRAIATVGTGAQVGLVAENAELLAALRGDRDGRVFTGWRASPFGDALRDVLDSGRALRVGADGVSLD